MTDQGDQAGTDQAAGRAAAAQAVASSPHPRRLVVAGAGTGKTSSFARALESAGGKGLAITFINALVEDLRRDLGDLATVATFHGFCNWRARMQPSRGLRADFLIYPPLFDVLNDDVSLLLGQGQPDVEARMQELIADASTAIAIRAGSYYNASAFTDLVYRVQKEWERDQTRIPTFSLVVVDEYQDFNGLEVAIIEQLASKSRILIAGDDDQALYGSTRAASPEYIRRLARSGAYETHELPYCSRCTQVVVGAARMVIARAVREGILIGRLEKPYQCYLPEKLEDSNRHPRILYARCSVERNNAPYISRYVAQQVAAIPVEDIAASKSGGWPTALVVGPSEFSQRVHAHLVANDYPHAIWKRSKQQQLALIDGYKLIAGGKATRLGWRIVVLASDRPDLGDSVRTALEKSTELADELPSGFTDDHSGPIDSVKAILEGREVDSRAVDSLTQRLRMSYDEVVDAVMADFDEDHRPPLREAADEPRIICTTLVGAKGLSAEHVFVVGLNDGHFPTNRDQISAEEACQLIVALTRTRKACHLVSTRRFGAIPVRESVFVDWLRPLLQPRTINAAYWAP